MSRGVLRMTVLVSAFLAMSAQPRAEDGTESGRMPLPQRGEKGSPKDVIPVPVIPDKMAVPAPTVQDHLKEPGEPHAVQPSGPSDIPEPEKRDVTPGVPQHSR
jgi:hypothetical protein